MSAAQNEPIDLRDPVREICQRLELDPAYVGQITLSPVGATIELFRGRDGRCQGAKYVDENGEAAIETLSFRVLA